jgi:hypothetical protein
MKIKASEVVPLVAPADNPEDQFNQLDLSYLELDFNKTFIDFDNNHLKDFNDDPTKAVLRMVRDINYLHFTCKHIFDVDLGPHQHAVFKNIYNFSNVMLIGSRGFSKSWLLALYICWVMLVKPGTKIVVVGAAFRQSKLIAQYCETFWNNAPVYRDLAKGGSINSGFNKAPDKWEFRVGESVCTFCPMGDGSTIRGLRAHIIIADEFSMIPVEVFEVVVRGFASVSSNPIGNMKHVAKIKKMRELGMINKDVENLMRAAITSNQVIISGTAYYSFNSFAEYWRKYKKILESMGSEEESKRSSKEKDDFIDPSTVCVIRIPAELIPDGFLDKATLDFGKQTMDENSYMMEFNAVFPQDSNGFYPRSIVERCVVKEPRDIGHEVVSPFTAKLKGSSNGCFHVMGVDPASSADNFSIVVLEVHETYRKVVYCWTIKKEKVIERIKNKLIKQQDYYGYCARQIRKIIKLFPNIQAIALDAQGGGEAVAEALADPDKFERNELPIYPVLPNHALSDGKDRHTDGLSGEHIIELVQFARAEWVSDANHGMKKDMLDGVLLFPFFDTVALMRAELEDKNANIEIDNLETCMLEIEELKNELGTIQHTQTPGTNRDKWDTPEIKKAENKKGRLRKDRYSALLMANAAARRLQRAPEGIKYMDSVGGLASNMRNRPNDGRLYIGPDHITNSLAVGFAIRRQ